MGMDEVFHIPLVQVEHCSSNTGLGDYLGLEMPSSAEILTTSQPGIQEQESLREREEDVCLKFLEEKLQMKLQ